VLQTLRPKSTIELESLSRIAESRPVEELLPSKLSESILLSLALDLRRVELMVKQDTEASSSLSVAIYLVTKYFMLLASPIGNRKISIPEESLFQAIQILSITVEREIVTRIIGVSDENGDEYLLSALRTIKV
jgi:hypothetical protein